MKKLIAIFVGLLALNGCSIDATSDPVIPEEPEAVLPRVTTQEPFVGNGIVKLNGTVITEGDEGYYERGFAWSLNTNPTVDNASESTDGSGVGPYFLDTLLGFTFELNTTYNLRAYLKTYNAGTIYGNNITFTTPNVYTVSTYPVLTIYSRSATLYGNITAADFSDTNVSNKGFCVSTSATPTITNSTIIAGNQNLGDFTAEVTDLNINTNYYVRSFGYDQTSNVIYGEIMTFRTTGFTGASGGYVFFDKGETTNGWRYLEAAPNDLIYNGSNLIKWGCYGSSILQTSKEVGTGLENTNRIIAACNAANCAARICSDYSVNGLSDWFLPSQNEMGVMSFSLNGIVNLGSYVDQVHWTSSQYDGATAWVYNTYLGFGPGFGVSKNNENLVRAVRRF